MIFGIAMPTAREWLFSAKTFAASMLALYIALAAGFPRPYWAMATVFIVVNPLAGATRSKALYRLAGTCAGAAAAVFFVPMFVNSPLLLSAVVAVWTGGLLFISFLDRTPRSYVFMLAGYTLPLIALPTVGDPSTVFAVAVARSQEIALGIICASLVNALVMPGKVGTVIGAQVGGWLSDARGWISAVLTGADAVAKLRESQRLAADVRGLDQLISQLQYDPEMGAVVRHARDLRARMAILPTLLSSLADRLAAVRRAGPMPRELESALASAAAWIDSPLGETSGRDDASVADGLRVQLGSLWAAYSERLDWEALLIKSAIARLRDVVDLWQDCSVLQEEILAGRNAQRRQTLRLKTVAAPVPHYDFGMMVFSAGSAVVATFVACSIWIFSGWDQGAGFVMIAAVACSFFATSDNPVPQARTLSVLTAIGATIAGVYVFGILPAVHNYVGLVLVFAPTFLVLGTLITRPQYMFIGLLLAVNTATLMSLQEVYTANFTSFVNSSIAAVAGGLFATVWLMATRPFGASYAVRRLVRAGWAEIAELARGNRSAAPLVFASRVLDRLGQLVPRLAQGAGGEVAASDILAEMRVGLNVLDLRQAAPSVPRELRPAIEAVLEGIADGFAAQARSGRRLPVQQSLLSQIDTALCACLTLPAGDARASTMQALVGLRLALFPDAQSPELDPIRQPAEPETFALAAE